MQKITPCLWFDNQAEEAASFYTSIFKNSSVGNVTHYSETVSKVAGRPAGSVLTVDFSLNGQPFIGLNGGPVFKFTEAVSFMVHCDDQEELDYFWDRLGEGGEVQQCGWLKDKFGLSWQVVPSVMEHMMNDPDTAKRDRVMAAIMEMKKLDIAALEQAFNG